MIEYERGVSRSLLLLSLAEGKKILVSGGDVEEYGTLSALLPIPQDVRDDSSLSLLA